MMTIGGRCEGGDNDDGELRNIILKGGVSPIVFFCLFRVHLFSSLLRTLCFKNNSSLFYLVCTDQYGNIYNCDQFHFIVYKTNRATTCCPVDQLTVGSQCAFKF